MLVATLTTITVDIENDCDDDDSNDDTVSSDDGGRTVATITTP